VSQTEIIQGRQIGPAQLDQIRHLLAEHPDWSRKRLSREVAQLWDWRNGVGLLKDMAARTLLLKLEQRGWIGLPPRRQTPFNRMRDRRLAEVPTPEFPALIEAPSVRLRSLLITEVSTGLGTRQRPLFDRLLHQYHYLSHLSTVGENLQYLVADEQSRPLACLLFGAAAWQCADRDRYLGWDPSQRAQHLHLVANNTRFLIAPGVATPQLASSVLSRVSRRLSRDWQAKYGHPISLLESFVERDRFAGTCYRAANWVRVGQTQGRTRQNRPDGTRYFVPVKDIYLYPLHRRFRQQWQGPSTPTVS
jgi:hypothetical protein